MRETYHNHVVPQWYLNQWAGEDQLLRVMHKPTGRMFAHTSANVCYEKELYTDLCEKAFASIEGEFMAFWKAPEEFIADSEGRVQLLRFIIQLAARQPTNVKRLLKHFSGRSVGWLAPQLTEAVIWSDSAVPSFSEHSWILFKSERRLLHTSECAVVVLDSHREGSSDQAIYFPISPGKGLLISRFPVLKHGWFPLTDDKANVFNGQLLDLTKTHVVFGQDTPEFLSITPRHR